MLKYLGVPIPGSLGGSTGNSAGLGAVGGVQAHSGGIIGGSGPTPRPVAPAMFVAAMRYHTGGIASFAPDEVPAIPQKHEEVLTTSDPRHRYNGGGEGASRRDVHVKNVTVFDPAAVMEQALSTKAGQKIFLNHVTKNKRSFQAAIA